MRLSKRVLSKKDQYLRIWDDYRKAHNNEPASTMTMIEWAEKEGLYAVDEAAARRRGAGELAEVLRTTTMPNSEGSDVRINMPFVDEEEGWLWDDMRTIRHDHMEIGAAHCRNRIVGETKSFAKQLNFYRNVHPDRPPILTSFNFENDLKDAGIPLPSSSEIEQLLSPTLGARQG